LIQKVLLIAVAGAIGTLARYSLIGLVQRVNTTTFPWGTVAVNVLGCFLAGLVFTLFENRWPVSAETRIVILVGFLGAFTTFSTLILESSGLGRSSDWLYALGNVLLQTGLGFGALYAGAALGRAV